MKIESWHLREYAAQHRLNSGIGSARAHLLVDYLIIYLPQRHSDERIRDSQTRVPCFLPQPNLMETFPTNASTEVGMKLPQGGGSAIAVFLVYEIFKAIGTYLHLRQGLGKCQVDWL